MAFQEAVAEFLRISEILTQDVVDATGPAIVGQARERRNYVRAVFAYIEGHVWGIKQLCFEVTSPGVLLPGEIAMLLEQTHDIKDNGSVFTRPAKIRLPPNIRLAFETLGRVFGTGHSFNVDDRLWPLFLDAIKVRDRLMHPKTSSDLNVTDSELALVQAGYAFYRSQQLEAIERVQAKAIYVGEITEAVAIAEQLGPHARRLVDLLLAALQPTGSPAAATGAVNSPSVHIVNGVMQIARDINDNPPTTPEAVDAAVRQLESYVLRAETGDFRLTGSDVRLTHRDKDGNVIGES